MSNGLMRSCRLAQHMEMTFLDEQQEQLRLQNKQYATGEHGQGVVDADRLEILASLSWRREGRESARS